MQSSSPVPEAIHRDSPLPDAGESTSPATEPATPRRGRVPVAWIVAIGVFVAIVIAGAFVHVTANRAFDAAVSGLLVATDDVREAAEALQAAVDDGALQVTASDVIIEAAADDLVDPASRTLFADASTVVGDAVDTAEGHLGVETPAAPEKPLWPWELIAETTRVEATTAGVTDLAQDLRESSDAIEDAGEQLIGAAGVLYASVAPAAAAVEAANVSAKNIVVLDFRDASGSAARQTIVGSAAMVAFSAYAEKAATLKASAQSELAEKAGELLATRLEIETFARTIAGGVVLDFDWAPVVLDIDASEGMAGTATWVPTRGGFSTITLSDSVATNWPSADARALVAHEVGHAITAKCSEKFDSASEPANEQWATAWAIGMGHTSDANGVQAYGYPPAEMIDTARTCR